MHFYLFCLPLCLKFILFLMELHLFYTKPFQATKFSQTRINSNKEMDSLNLNSSFLTNPSKPKPWSKSEKNPLSDKFFLLGIFQEKKEKKKRKVSHKCKAMIFKICSSKLSLRVCLERRDRKRE